MTKDKLIEHLKVEFPYAWFKDGQDFSGDESCLVWTGEGSMYDNENGIPLFDYHGAGIHPALEIYLDDFGLYCECYDPGTYLIYKI